jgi:glycosyltransferase involved in cell wall biosynthesis
MLIGIDGSRAFFSQRTGTENYTYEMLRALAAVDQENHYRIFIRSQKSEVRSQDKFNQNSKQQINWDLEIGNSLGQLGQLEIRNSLHPWPSNFTLIPLHFPRLFTQVGLALHTWTDNLDLLWVPAHTLPILGHPRLPMVITLHGVEYQHLPTAYKWGQNLHLTWSTRWAVIRAQKIIAVSQKTKADLLKWLSVDPKKITVIHEGVSLERFKPPKTRGTRRRLVQGKNTIDHVLTRKTHDKRFLKKYRLNSPYILFVGTFQPRKNLPRLIEAFSIFLKTYNLQPTTYNLILAGKPGWDYQDIYSAPDKYGVGDRVQFLGYVPDQDLPALYRHAALYVEPSLQEGFGLPILEAMASGVPVAAANAGALPEVAGNAAILFNPQSSQAIAQALALGLSLVPASKLNQHSDLKIPSGTSNLLPSAFKAELVRRGNQQVKKFSWHQAARKLVTIFERINKP